METEGRHVTKGELEMEKSDLQTKVEEWLRKQGYPLELRTARVFRRRGWFLHHSRRYKDGTLGKEREIDLLAFNDDPAAKYRIHGHFVIECKWTPEKPWILFTSEQQSLTPLGHFRSTPMTQNAAREVSLLVPEDVGGFPLFAGIEEGYAIVQAFSKDSAIDAAYSAMHAVIQAADFFARDMTSSSNFAIVYVPTIVIDGELFKCTLGEGGDVSVERVDMGCLIYHSADNAEVRTTCVHIVRESKLERFIDRAEVTFGTFRAILKKRREEPRK